MTSIGDLGGGGSQVIEPAVNNQVLKPNSSYLLTYGGGQFFLPPGETVSIGAWVDVCRGWGTQGYFIHPSGLDTVMLASEDGTVNPQFSDNYTQGVNLYVDVPSTNNKGHGLRGIVRFIWNGAFGSQGYGTRRLMYSRWQTLEHGYLLNLITGSCHHRQQMGWLVTVIGGGGAGGTTVYEPYKSNTASGGGGAAVVFEHRFLPGDLAVGGAISITVGAGGVVSAVRANMKGPDGGSSAFGNLITCTGGIGGNTRAHINSPLITPGGLGGTTSFVSASGVVYTGGKGGSGGNHRFGSQSANVAGSKGENAGAYVGGDAVSFYGSGAPNYYVSAGGGGASLGNGGKANYDKAGSPGQGYGSGGGGGSSVYETTGRIAGNGANGVVIVKWGDDAA